MFFPGIYLLKAQTCYSFVFKVEHFKQSTVRVLVH